MALQDSQSRVLDIMNAVLAKLELDPVTTLDETKMSKMLLQLLNEVVAELNDIGDWRESYAEVFVTAVASAQTYTFPINHTIKRVEEIVFDTQASPMELMDAQDIRRLNRLSRFGTPRQYAFFDIDKKGNPKFRVSPVPTSTVISNSDTGGFNVAYYKKPSIYTINDTATFVPFPANVVILGLYHKALLEENDGNSTRESQAASAIYIKARQEALNRYNADTGTDLYFVPRNRYGR